MEVVLENSYARAVRYGSPLSVAMVDIDHFKKYNDTYGHAAGDKLLQEVAGVLKKSVRGVDLVARYGGEEFLILIHEISFEKSCAVVERIRNTVQQITAVTVSIGLAAYRAGMKKEEVIERADAALYRAKEGGRNRVVCV
jgi:diguanylate cyclase (GGDEF)-like protein